MKNCGVLQQQGRGAVMLAAVAALSLSSQSSALSKPPAHQLTTSQREQPPKQHAHLVYRSHLLVSGIVTLKMAAPSLEQRSLQVQTAQKPPATDGLL